MNIENNASTDADGDGYFAWDDCDDNDPSVPNVNDQDCDGVTVSGGDCDDNDVTIYPFASDTYGDGIDSDCDGLDCTALTNLGAYYSFCQDIHYTNWSDSSQHCANKGSYLVRKDDANESQWVSTFASTEYQENYVKYLLIDVRDLLSNGQWTLSDGSNLSYSDWGANQPSGDGSCASLNTRANTYYGWNDHTCIEGEVDLFGLICEYR